ncbi:MAG: alanine--tRNA ligase [Candidatus Sungbacteria bacterium]|uniref:alanine--tRNA ligase n=1 Tax=Candidatus Sungiibacteriota bacterium TaxID=2750080 RepID=A0A932QYG5_9BACT|nr:alanine--tRNA ligase [Candidatus Sungbacteria bacterium]
MHSEELRKKFLDFFARRGHAIVPSSSLIPNDPSVLLTTAGMQQFKKYYTDPEMADRDFGSRNTVSIQKSFRTSDIDEVGDERHLTFFEMMGNFSFGGYFKEDAIRYAHEFLTKEIRLEISYVTIFHGRDDIGIPQDKESARIWRDLGITDIREEGMEDVFWGPTGSSGPCGPTTEIYCKNGAGQDIEIWNIVFNEFFCSGSREELLAGNATLEPLATKGIDTGMGLERLAMIVQKTPTIFETDLFVPLIKLLSGNLDTRQKRIIVDHVRAVIFLTCDGVRPSNREAGYILRRLMRRVIAFAEVENIGHSPEELLKAAVGINKSDYRNLDFGAIEEVYKEEYTKFLAAVGRGRKEFEKEANEIKTRKIYIIPRAFAFNLYQSAGITIDVLDDFAKKEGVEIDKKAFAEDLERHKEISRAGVAAKFGGHGLYMKTGEVTIRDESEVERVTRLHTATHLLHAGLRAVLGPEVRQDGSDITVQRTRFDFRFPRKLTHEELQKVEEWVDDAIGRDIKVIWEEMSYDEALGKGAVGFFREKYPARVKVYTMYDEQTGEVLSRELCGGPHVSRTGAVGHFKIVKEESSSAGIRRIRGVLTE